MKITDLVATVGGDLMFRGITTTAAVQLRRIVGTLK